jgi:hypothetical protein
MTLEEKIKKSELLSRNLRDLNEEKIRAEFENFIRPLLESHVQKHKPAHLLTSENSHGYSNYIINEPLEVDFIFLKSLWQAALATRPDVNQEMVEALEQISNPPDRRYVSDYDIASGSVSIAQEALAKHKASNTTLHCRDYVRNILIEAIGVYNGWEESAIEMVDKCIIPTLKSAGALRLKGE